MGPPEQARTQSPATQAFRAAISAHQRGDIIEAQRLYEAVLTVDRKHFGALYNLGHLRLRQRQLDQAVALFRRALNQRLDSSEAHNSIGAAFEMLTRYEEAISHYQKALAIKPDQPEVLGNLGNVLITVNRLSDAVTCLEKAIALRPDLAAAQNNLGRALYELGRLDKARQHFEMAVALEPRRGMFHRWLADATQFKAGDPHLMAMEALARDAAALSADDQVELHFALGKACEDLGEHERSFQHLLEGNRLKRQQIVYDEAAALRSFERIRAVFTDGLMRSKAGLGDPSTVPVFIVGMPRSGTTLVEQILASHPKVFGAGEIPNFDEAVIHVSRSRRSGPGYPEIVPLLKGEQLHALGARYVAAIRGLAPEAERITNKLPANFLLVGLIHLALPNTRIIHTIRDPIDTCLSCFSNLFAGPQPHTYDLGELGRHYRAYRKLMLRWRELLPDGVMLEVRYEDVVANLEQQARRMVSHCGLDWDDACLSFYKTERPVLTASAGQVRRPIYHASVGRSRPYQHLLRPLLDALNGDPPADNGCGGGAANDASLRGSTTLPETANPLQGFQAALSLHRQGNLTDAERRYRSVLAADPNHFDSLHNLGRLYMQQGKLDEALPLLRKALDRKANSAEAHNSLGTVLRMLNRHDEAIVHYRKALAIRPDYPQALANLGNEFFVLNRLQEAVSCLEKTISLEPGLAAAHHDLGRVFHGLGQLEEAGRAFATAIALEPGTARFYRSLSELKRFTAGDAHLLAMQALASECASLSVEEQIQLHFALGKAYADIGRHEDSFGHLSRGNRIVRGQISYDEAATLESFERVKAAFTPELMRSKAGFGDPSPVPLFILGMPRSGTTLVEQILASHPRVFGGGELSAFKDAVKDAVVRLRGAEGGPVSYPEAVRLLTGKQLRTLGARYVTAIRKCAPKAAHITDKMPANFLLAGVIPLALPNARIILMRRDPIDTCLSCFAILFAGDQPHTYDLAELGRYYRAYEDLMEHWRTVMPDRIMLEVQYEEVVADLEGQARRILGHCGLDWDDACLSFHETRRPVWTASAAQVRQPIYRSSVARWRPYKDLLRPLLEALGPLVK